MRWLRATVLMGWCFGPLTCLVYTEDLLLPAESATCSRADECPAGDSACLVPTCEGSRCGLRAAPPGSPCGDGLCDDLGNCVSCGSSNACPGGTVCSLGRCVDGRSLDHGEACGLDGACESNHCVDSVCCENDCSGSCLSCNSGVDAGHCILIADGTDPDDECGLDACNGSGSCRCSDGQLDGQETDQDCGGPACPACADGLACESEADCQSGRCSAKICGPSCGDKTVDVGEDCDDGNNISFDGCSANCKDPTGHLLISEIAVRPTPAGEFIEIYNPTAQSIDLSQIYLADADNYFRVTQSVSPITSDFVMHFPPGASIAPGAFVVVSLETSNVFSMRYGFAPDFDLVGTQGVPTMLGDIGGNAGLTDAGELVVLFQWDGLSDLVTDLDYLHYGASGQIVNKTGITVGAGSYLNDTLPLAQVAADTPDDNDTQSLHRCDTAESSETKSGGNGFGGHDETSENGQLAWRKGAASPKAPPADDLCR